MPGVKRAGQHADSAYMHPEGRVGAGQFQWNRGGWFGSQIGATLWFVLLGGLLLAQGRLVGASVVALGLLANAIGLVLWRRRFTLLPYPAIQMLVAVAGVAAAAALLAVWGAGGNVPALQGGNGFAFLAIYPALMLMFHFQERRARKRAA